MPDQPRVRLHVRPMSYPTANKFVQYWHRHNKPVLMARFAVCCRDDSGYCHGVAICANPVARMLDDGETLEVVRVATDGTFNACSILYGACGRIAREMGYRRVFTYTLHSESMASLKAVGWKLDAEDAGGVSWARPNDPRRAGRTEQGISLQSKNRWVLNIRDKSPFRVR